MKQLIYIIVFILVIDLTFQNCANPGAPTGGPKDTIPPTLTLATPVNGTTNFKESTIELEFSEYVNTEKLKQQLIITPSTDIQYKSIVKRNKLIIRLDGSLQDSTTYNFNFANGVTDITEKNPVVNLSIAFSTGPTIDSMSISGTVEELLTEEPGNGYVVGLYPQSDSLNYFSEKPTYFTTAGDSGIYNINYIKKGVYKILAFNDENGNFLFDPDTESHGFLEEEIYLDSVTVLRPIRCLLQNVRPIALINARPVGRYVDIKFNKTIDSYQITPEVSSNIVGENNDVVRLYKDPSIAFRDSLTSYIVASDSLGNEVIDTLNYVYIESNRKPTPFNHSFINNNLQTGPEQILRVLFDKPVVSFDTSKVVLQSDTLINYAAPFQYEWNTNNTRVNIYLNITNQLLDSLISSAITEDTVLVDSAKSQKQTPTPEFLLSTQAGAFVSVENDTSSNKSIPVKRISTKSSGVLKVSLDTDETHFYFQLLDQNNNVVHQVANTKTFNLSSVRAGQYNIRILIDSNQDGKWSYGNLLKNEEPEEVFITQEKTSIRENWEVELSITF